MNHHILFIVCVLIANLAGAQARDAKQYSKDQRKGEKNAKGNQVMRQEEGDFSRYEKQMAFAIQLNTDGYVAFFEKGRRKTQAKSRIFRIDLGERKHPKEVKVVPGAPGTLPKKYVFGKINNFYYAKATYAQQQVVGNRGNKNGVEVSAIYGGGISAGLMKPYYLKVGVSRIIEDVRYNNNEDIFLNNPQQIYGATGFSKGLSEIKVTPGASVKTALRFDYGHYNSILSALEVGLNAEIYSRKMQQMLLVKNKQSFFNAYVAIVVGRRK